MDFWTRWLFRLAITLTMLASSLGHDPRIPAEVRFKTGFVNPGGKPRDFHSAMLWGIAIADTRVRGYEQAQVEIAFTQLSCRVDGNDVILNRDVEQVRGGLYVRIPWFQGNRSEPMAIRHSSSGTVVLRVGERPDRIWHFWAASPRAVIPEGAFDGCTMVARVKVSPGALLQVGIDYWRDPTIGFGPGGNNHEAGASDWYFSSKDWQEVRFTVIGQPKF